MRREVTNATFPLMVMALLFSDFCAFPPKKESVSWHLVLLFATLSFEVSKKAVWLFLKSDIDTSQTLHWFVV